MSQAVESFFGIFAMIVGVAIVAVLFSQKSQTPQVLQAFGSAITNTLGVAVSPVTGASFTPSGAYPSSGFTNFGF
jgi:uncharacterized membrane protein HdeD (DUF308 family)